MSLQTNNEKWDRLMAVPKYPTHRVYSKSQSKLKCGVSNLDSRVSERLNLLAQPKRIATRQIEKLIPIKRTKPTNQPILYPEDTKNRPKGILKNSTEPLVADKPTAFSQRRQIWLDLRAQPKTTINIDTNPDYERIVKRKPDLERISQLARPKHKHYNMSSTISL